MGIQYITDNTACNYDSSVKKRKSTNHNQTSSCFTVYRSTDSFSMTLEFFRLRSRLRNPNHKRAPTQIKAKCAEGGFGEVMSHTHPSAGLHYSQRQSFQCRQDRAAPGHPCIRCCLWLLPLSSQLCCWQWKIICVLLCLNVPRVLGSNAQCCCIRWRHIRFKPAWESKTMMEAEDQTSSRTSRFESQLPGKHTKHDWNGMQSNIALFYFRKYFFYSFCWTFDYYIL